MKILLGSQSSFRRALMAKIADELGATFETTSADIDEKAIRDPNPKQLVIKLAIAKADAICAQGNLDADLLITGDQVVSWNGTIVEKPLDEADARAMLRGYRHSTIEIIPSVAVRNLHTGQTVSGIEVAKVTFNDIPESVIDELIEKHEALKCAGALRASLPIMQTCIHTSDNLNVDVVRSLPIALTLRLIAQVTADEIILA